MSECPFAVGVLLSRCFGQVAGPVVQVVEGVVEPRQSPVEHDPVGLSRAVSVDGAVEEQAFLIGYAEDALP